MAEPEEARGSPMQIPSDRRRIEALERECTAMKTAQAEAAALMVLSQKLEAIAFDNQFREPTVLLREVFGPYDIIHTQIAKLHVPRIDRWLVHPMVLGHLINRVLVRLLQIPNNLIIRKV